MSFDKADYERRIKRTGTEVLEGMAKHTQQVINSVNQTIQTLAKDRSTYQERVDMIRAEIKSREDEFSGS